MIGLILQLVRLCVSLLRLILSGLILLVEWGAGALARRVTAARVHPGLDDSRRREPASPSRRRAYTAPRRPRRSAL